MNKSAKDYNSEGLKLVENGRYEAAVDFFTLAIEEDPGFYEAYRNRGEALIKLDRIDEGEKDIEIAEKAKKKTDKFVSKKPKQKKVVEKFNLQEAEDLYGSLLSDESAGFEDDDEMYGLDDLLYDDTAPDDVMGYDQADDVYADQFEDDTLPDDANYSDSRTVIGHPSETTDVHIAGDIDLTDAATTEEAAGKNEESDEILPAAAETVFSGTIEYIGGMRQEFTQARLFEPLENSLLILDEETADEQVIFFEQLTCLRISGLPAGVFDQRQESGTREAIETVDGKIYQARVLPEQPRDHLLICRPADDQASCAFALFPVSNIRKRTLDIPVTDILLEKRFISKVMLKKACQEYEQLKNLTLEKIVAQRARIPLAEIEEAFNQARQNGMGGLQKEEILLISGLASEDVILEAVDHLEYVQPLKFGEFLAEKGYIKERELYVSLALKHKIPFVDLQGRKFARKTFSVLPKNLIVKHEILPLVLKDDILLVATFFINATHMSEAVMQKSGCKQVKYVLSTPSDIRSIIKLIYGRKNK